ncbi:MAG: hypothetical protein IPH20_23245 [Bacteroidales bacterium]|nr:hypothetical protein [Bacteroidales bacterium]
MQIINGQNVFGNLTLNNAAVNLNGNTTVNGVFTFTNGRLNLLTHNLTMGTAATVAGAPSASHGGSHGTGQLRKSFSAAGSFLPVGDNIGTAEYSPVSFDFYRGTFGSGNYAGVNLANLAYPVPVEVISTVTECNTERHHRFYVQCYFKYMPADVIGTENLIYCLRITPTSVAYFSANQYSNRYPHHQWAHRVRDVYPASATGEQKPLTLPHVWKVCTMEEAPCARLRMQAGRPVSGLTATRLSY